MMRRHLAKYIPGIPNFREIRIRLLRAETYSDVTTILDEIVENYGHLRPDYSE